MTGSGFTKGWGRVLCWNATTTRTSPLSICPHQSASLFPLVAAGFRAPDWSPWGLRRDDRLPWASFRPRLVHPCGWFRPRGVSSQRQCRRRLPATDAASYPCPPTAAQTAAGDSCVLAFGDSSSSDPQVKVLISFVPAPTASPVSQSTGASVTQGGSAGAASTSPATGSSTPGSANGGTLAFTGVPVLACGPSSWAASS